MLPVEGEAVEHEGAGEPVEVHDEGLAPQHRVPQDVRHPAHPANVFGDGHPCKGGELIFVKCKDRLRGTS